ncbi:MAG TPA: hypothetical protein VLT91_07540 [Rhizomicrobium sp.]|nr:hypothetical protein [Rhizomicrobium sp.]
MSSETIASSAARRLDPFASYHQWDRNFLLAIAATVWFGVILGFGSDLVRHFATPHVAYPLIVHFHAVAFGGWLVVLTAQILLMRSGRPDLHRKLGTAAIALAAIMVVLGPATAIAMQRAQFGTTESDPSFLAAQLLSILAFAGLASAAFVMRGSPSAHKRLILLATFAISDAGFARWLGGYVHAALVSGFVATLWSTYLGSEVLIAGLGAYDLVTRRRLHPAYVAGAVWLVTIQIIATLLMRDPHWKVVAMGLIGH